MQRAANESWFDFSIASQNVLDAFKVYSFTGTEAVNEPYEFAIELVHAVRDMDLLSFMGKAGLLSIADKSGGKRLVHGLIREMEQLHTGNAHTHYRVHLVPAFWFLRQNSNHRIYQHMSVTDIINDVLTRQRFTAEMFEINCFTKYEQREYCVQYGESDFHFLNRLCEEEGIRYHFVHSENGHCLCFHDTADADPIPGESDIRYFQGSGNVADTAVAARVNFHQRVNSDAVTYREYNYEYPALDVQAATSEPSFEGAPVPNGLNLEYYRYPHLHQDADKGGHYADVQLLRQLTFHTWVDIESDVSRFTPAFRFTLHSHPKKEVNSGWWVVSVSHKGEQPQVLEHEAPSDRGFSYNASVRAIPKRTRFVPEVRHEKRRIDGVQSAVVTGASGEEIYPDDLGRVKVHFFWDRTGPTNEKSSCWVRVADTWAGTKFGSIRIPRIGQEVLVEYMEGDPDRPVITGRVYNGLNGVPWNLPDQKVLSGLQSKEMHGRMRNQLVLDDTQGEVQLQLSSDHALSQMSLGYVTRIDHQTGRGDFRGEGFELRTDAWGVVRAAKGLVLTTEERQQARAHHKDMPETLSRLQDGEALHNEAMRLSVLHKTVEQTADADPVKNALAAQNADVKGDGPNKELSAPHLVLASPAGIALTTPHSVHTHTGEHALGTSSGHISHVAGKNFMATALEAVRLFAHKLGIRLFAGQGKVEIQAHSDDIDIIAQKVLRLISTQERIELVAAKEIILTADNSYLKVGGYGIECGSQGRFVARASSHDLEGPDTGDMQLPDLPESATRFNDAYVVRDQATGDPIANMRYEIQYPNGSKVSGVTGEDGAIPEQKSLAPDLLNIRLLGVEE